MTETDSNNDKTDPRRRRCPECGSPNVRRKNTDSIQKHPHRHPGDYYCEGCRVSFEDPIIVDEPAERQSPTHGLAAKLEQMDPDDLGGGRDA